ncbi:Guanine nucleotide-binding protein alpha-2 subunit [Puccinia graminis f. sp. tritici]|uniref:Guanine nucleotide-binding protein alpha-2 subunit n=1 Tax=Puccinia graminis f. sp. tritici TaxID=56615 RepID=A0A5B0LK59_PUCGR|nr:Guanine nucleotide-binding protein alpha-2 subunit [Puccinia graminis f. sp. tritici]
MPGRPPALEFRQVNITCLSRFAAKPPRPLIRRRAQRQLANSDNHNSPLNHLLPATSTTVPSLRLQRQSIDHVVLRQTSPTGRLEQLSTISQTPTTGFCSPSNVGSTADDHRSLACGSGSFTAGLAHNYSNVQTGFDAMNDAVGIAVVDNAVGNLPLFLSHHPDRPSSYPIAQAAVVAMRKLKLDPVKSVNQSYSDMILDYRLDFNQHGGGLNLELVRSIKLLWHDPIIPAILDRGSEFYLMDSAG